jgi:general stress protein 26
MAERAPRVDLDERFSSPGATPTPWAAARDLLKDAKVYWISTVRPDGRPHVTPMAGVWVDEVLYFTTGGRERKAMNLAENTNCVVTTGSNAFDGLDVVIEGQAVRVTDEETLRHLAVAYTVKYDDFFGFQVRDGALHAAGSQDEGLAFELRPTKAFGFAKGEVFSQTRYRF